MLRFLFCKFCCNSRHDEIALGTCMFDCKFVLHKSSDVNFACLNLDVVTGQIASGWSHMQKQAPQTKERTKVESHANIMFGPQLKSFMRIFNCFRFQQTCARSSQCFFFTWAYSSCWTFWRSQNNLYHRRDLKMNFLHISSSCLTSFNKHIVCAELVIAVSTTSNLGHLRH